MAAGTALEIVAEDGDYLVGPWRLWDRQTVEGADQPTDELGQPTDAQGHLLHYSPRDLFQGTAAQWLIVAGPYGPRTGPPPAPRRRRLQVRPAGSRFASAEADFASVVEGAFEYVFLLYEGKGPSPLWGEDPDQSLAALQAPIGREVLEHIDAVVGAVRQINQTEPSPIEAVFFDGLVDQLEVLRDHVEGIESTQRPYTVLRYLRYVWDRLNNLRIPAIATQLATITRALGEILRIAEG